MFALSIEALIDAINAKRKEDLTIRSLLYSMVPNPNIGYPEESPGEFETESDYNNLIWSDERQKPTWAELQSIRQSVFDQERAFDLDQLRQMRYTECPIEYGGNLFNVNPLMIALVSSQLEYAKLTQLTEISIPTSNKIIKSLTVSDIEILLNLMRSKLNDWIIDPRTS